MINVNDSYTNEITEQYKNLVNPYEILFTTKQRQFYSLKLNISAIICKILSCLSFFSDIGKFPDLTECFEEGISDPERKNSSWSKSSPILVFSADSAKRGYTNVHDFNDCKLTFYSQKSPEEIPEILTLFSFVILEKTQKHSGKKN